jgi:hypothetical protein
MSGSDKKGGSLFPKREVDDLSTHAHRQLIGSVGLVLPVALWLLAGFRPTSEFPWFPLGSISAYYYSGAVSVFAGMLVAMALFLFTYRGYANRYYRRDRIAAILAGSAALLVALFPTGAPEKSLILAWWTPLTGIIHFASATILFVSFIYFCVFQFPMANKKKKKPLPLDKKFRNVVYFACGAAMMMCIFWAFFAGITLKPIFWPEALALEFFALSWLVKGRAYTTVAAAGRKTVYYARHPRTLVKDVQSAVQSQPPAEPAEPRTKRRKSSGKP